MIVQQDIADIPTIGRPRRLLTVGIDADDGLLDALPGGTLAHPIDRIDQLIGATEAARNLRAGVGPDPAHVGGPEPPRIAGDFRLPEGCVASDARFPGFAAAAADVLVPA